MKLLFFDIDNTLCPFGEEPGARTLAAIKSAQQHGHRAFLCTGRAPSAISPTLQRAGFDGMIAAAGSYAEAQGKVLIDEPLTAEQLQKTIQVLVKNGISYTLECYHGNYTYFYTAKELVSTVTPPELLAILGMQRVLKRSMRLKPMKKYPGEPVYKLCFVCRTKEQMEEPAAVLSDFFEVVIQKNSFPRVSAVVGELIPRGRNKGTAMEAVCQLYDTTCADAIAFGDSPNDYPMLQTAGMAVVMGNADPAVQAMADLVCPPCAEQGVAEALIQLGLTTL